MDLLEQLAVVLLVAVFVVGVGYLVSRCIR
jgi:hypothetical protein